jgi:hypothetical protein
MTVLSTLQRASTVLGLAVPTAIFASTDREHIELADVANEAAEAMADFYDWQRLKTIATFTGNGVTEDFNLPSDYRRMTLKSTLWVSSMPFTPLEHVLDFDTWLGIIVSNTQLSIGQWIIYGNQFHIRPALASSDTAKFTYITKNIILSGAGDPKELFSVDTDVFKLDERVLRLGIVWRWKSNKGLPYAEDMQNYEIALAEAVGRDKGTKTLTVGVGRIRGGLASEYAYPGIITP